MLRSIAKQSEESVESVLNEQTNELNIGRKVRNKLALDRKCRNIILFISYNHSLYLRLFYRRRPRSWAVEERCADFNEVLTNGLPQQQLSLTN